MVLSLLWDLYQQWKTPEPQTEVIFFHDEVIIQCNNHSPINSCTNKDCYFYKIGRIITCIENAQHSIDLCFYMLTVPSLSDALVRARKRGIKMRVISDHSMAYSRGSKVVDLLKIGADVRTRPTEKIMHHKFCICDYNTPSQYLLTGSLNWTQTSVCGGSLDNVIITQDQTLIEPFQSEFNKLWINFSENQKHRKCRDFKSLEKNVNDF